MQSLFLETNRRGTRKYYIKRFKKNGENLIMLLAGWLMKQRRFVAIATTVGVKTKENYAARDNLPSHPKKWN